MMWASVLRLTQIARTVLSALKPYSGGSALMRANEFGNITRTHRAILRACMDATRANRRGRHAVESFSEQRV